MKYSDLQSINISANLEKKNRLSYLSWAHAVHYLLSVDPAATWEYLDPVMYGDTMMVFCRVNAFGKSMTAHLPVMDHKNVPISNPHAFAVNTAMQRCLVKAIALHGIGLSIYAGEDLPLDSPDLRHEDDDAEQESHPHAEMLATCDPYAEMLATFKAAAALGTKQLVKIFRSTETSDLKNEVWSKHANLLKEIAASADGQAEGVPL